MTDNRIKTGNPIKQQPNKPGTRTRQTVAAVHAAVLDCQDVLTRIDARQTAEMNNKTQAFDHVVKDHTPRWVWWLIVVLGFSNLAVATAILRML